MAGLTETTKREFAKRVLDILNSNSEELSAQGVNIQTKSENLASLIEDAFMAEEAQLKARTEANRATEKSQNATTMAYKTASDSIELIIGAIGKDDALSKRLRSLRSEIANEELRGKRKEKAE